MENKIEKIMAFVCLETLPLKTNIILGSNKTKVILLGKCKKPEASVPFFSLKFVKGETFGWVLNFRSLRVPTAPRFCEKLTTSLKYKILGQSLYDKHCEQTFK